MASIQGCGQARDAVDCVAAAAPSNQFTDQLVNQPVG
jgi:hypothetical protein